jgi:putative acetyltransferase
MELALSLWDDGSFQAQCSEGLATLKSSSLSVREMRSEDARAFLEVHHKAVRELAAVSYPSEVIEAWAPLPITERHVRFVCANADQEFRLVAELNGEIIGIGCLMPQNNELRACYVAPSAVRKGVGSAILREIERAACDRGIRKLWADSSLTAEPFYRANGYEICGLGEHVLNSGVRMTCVKVRKDLAPRTLSSAAL